MAVGTNVKIATAITFGVVLAATRLPANTNKAADAAFFSKITDCKALFQDTTKQKVNRIEVEMQDNGNFKLVAYKYDNGTDASGTTVAPYYLNYLGHRIVSDYIVLEYADKIVVFRPNQIGSKENVVFEKKNGATWTAEPKGSDPTRLVVTIDGTATEISHNHLGKLHSSSQRGNVID